MCEEGSKIYDKESESVEENESDHNHELSQESILSSIQSEFPTVQNTMPNDKIGSLKHEGNRPLEEIKEGEDFGKNDTNIYKDLSYTQG